jgi:hypothetical protein
MSECLAETGETVRSCGLASTYNNAGCRGKPCQDAIAGYRRSWRSEKAPKEPKKKSADQQKEP